MLLSPISILQMQTHQTNQRLNRMGASYIQLADRIFNGPNSSGNPKTEVFAVLVQAGSEPTYTFDDYSYTKK